MRRRHILAVLLAALLSPAGPVAAGAVTVRIVRPVDLLALPLLVMQDQHLIERVADAMAVRAVRVRWTADGAADPLAALAAGKADFVVAPLAEFLRAADAGFGTRDEIRALGAIVQRPYVLVTRNPKIATILDFTAADRIAVPALKTSGQALMLEMAAAQEWGMAEAGRLDRLMVAMSDAAATKALIAGTGGITAHVSYSPYVDEELDDKAVHRVMDSYDVAGPQSVAVLVGRTRFVAAHPILGEAILSALQSADDFITKSPGAASETYGAMNRDAELPVEEISDLIGNPDLKYRAAPAGIRHLASFMYRLGRLKHRPESWKDYFFRTSRDLPGS